MIDGFCDGKTHSGDPLHTPPPPQGGNVIPSGSRNSHRRGRGGGSPFPRLFPFSHTSAVMNISSAPLNPFAFFSSFARLFFFIPSFNMWRGADSGSREGNYIPHTHPTLDHVSPCRLQLLSKPAAPVGSPGQTKGSPRFKTNTAYLCVSPLFSCSGYPIIGRGDM